MSEHLSKARTFMVQANSSMHGPDPKSREEQSPNRCPLMLKFSMSNSMDRFQHLRSLWACVSGSKPCGPILLASMTSSISANTKRKDEKGLFRGPKLLVQTLMGLPRQFLIQQATSERIYDFHQHTNGFFPRPCPQCNSGEFFVRTDMSSRTSGTAPSQASGPVVFESRPVVCDQCSRWFHAGCLGAR